MHRLGFEFNAGVCEFLLRLPNFDGWGIWDLQISLASHSLARWAMSHWALSFTQVFAGGPHGQRPRRDRMGPNGIQPSVPASENGQPKGSGLAQREVVEFNTFFEKWINGEVPNDSETFQRLTKSFCFTTYSCKAFMVNVVLRWPDVGSGTLVTMLSTFLRLQGLQWCIVGGWRKVSWNLLLMHKINMASPRTRSSAHG